MHKNKELERFREENILTATLDDFQEIVDPGVIKKYYPHAPEIFKPALLQRFIDILKELSKKFPDPSTYMKKLEKQWDFCHKDLRTALEKAYQEPLRKFLMLNPSEKEIAERHQNCPLKFKGTLAKELEYLISRKPKKKLSFQEIITLLTNCNLKERSVLLDECEEIIISLLNNQRGLTKKDIQLLHNICPIELKYLFFVV